MCCLYRRLIAAGDRSFPNPHSEIRAQVLSSAIEGVVHDAARRGILRSSETKLELIRLVDGYLTAFGKRLNPQTRSRPGWVALPSWSIGDRYPLARS
jgi:hypothetical protein